MLITLLLLALAILSFFVFYYTHVLIHELGHGIPSLIFTKKKVTLFIGCMDYPKRFLKIPIGRLVMIFNLNLFQQKGGLCKLEESEMNFKQQLIMIAMGPIASFLVALVLIYLCWFTSIHDNVKTLCFILCVYVLAGIVRNIIPNDRPILLKDGHLTYNDGKQIQQLLALKRVNTEYVAALDYYNKQQYQLAVLEFEKIIAQDCHEQQIYKLLLSSLLQIKDKQRSSELIKIYTEKYLPQFDAFDYGNVALIHSYNGNYDKALEFYGKALESEAHRDTHLNNRGYTYNLMGNYELALQDFEEAIQLDESFAYALNNRGFAKIKLGLKEDGLKDLETSMTLDDLNSYCYLNFGIYHLENGDHATARDYFLKTQELDPKTVQLDYYLDLVKDFR